MKKIIAGIVSLFLCALFLPITVYGAENSIEERQAALYEKSGAGDLYDALDNETQENLAEAGIHSANITKDLSTENILRAMSSMLQDKIYGPLRAFLAVLAIIILTQLAASFENDGLSQTVSLVGAVTASGILIAPVISLIASLKTVITASSAFLLASAPVYAGLLIASGKVQTGTSYAAMTMGVGNAVPILAGGIIIPLLNIFLALAVVSSVSSVKLEKFSESLYKVAKWILIFIVTIFTGILSLQTLVGAHLDGISEKAVKLLASSAIPVVGGAISDSISVVMSGIQMVKSGVGAFGILASLFLFLPLLLEMVLWLAVCGACEITSHLFECAAIGRFMGACAAVLKMMLAVLISICAVCIICASIVVAVRAGV